MRSEKRSLCWPSAETIGKTAALARIALLETAVLAMPWLAGCGAGASVSDPKRLDQRENPYAREGERIKANPVAYLRDLCARCEGVKQYRLTFYRQERSGLLQKVGPLEKIRAAFRAEPFSVKFEWDDPASDYFESVYVAGQNDNKLIIRERKGIFPFPAQVRVIDPELPQKIGKAKRPITNFGLARSTCQIVQLFDDPKLAGALTVSYEGVVNLDPMQRPAHHVRIQQTPVAGYLHTVRDFYIDAETLLPAGVDLWTRPGQLDARYHYADVDTHTILADADFRVRTEAPKKP